MADVPEGYKKGRKPLNETWNPETPISSEFVPRALGWNFTFEQRLELYKLQQEEEARKWQLEQANLSVPDRAKQQEEFKWLSLEGLVAGQYLSGSVISEAKESLKSGEWKFSKKGITERVSERISPSDILYPEETPKTEFATKWERYTYEEEQKRLPLKRFVANVVFDPVTWVTSGSGSAVSFISSNGKKIYLNAEGVTALSKSNFISKVTNSLGEIKYFVNPESRHAFSQLLRDPVLAKQYITKEGLKFIGKEILPKQYLPWNYISPGFSVISKGVQSGLNPVTSAIQRVYRNTFNKPIPMPSPEYTALKIGYEANLAGAKKAIQQNIDALADEAQKSLGKYANARKILAEYIENPNIRQYFPELAGIAERFEQLHQQRAAIEKAHGILTSTRYNYIRHYLTVQAKTLLGKFGKSKLNEMQAPFAVQRNIEGTIQAINKKYIEEHGVKLFNDDAFFLLQKRLYESETALQTIGFLTKIKTQFGKTAKEASQMKNYVKSSIPQLRDTYLPKEIEQALKNDKEVAFLLDAMGKKTKKEIAYQMATMPLKGAYTVNKAVTGIFQRLVTRYFPGFYVLNLYGGKFMAYVFGETVGMEKETIDIMRGKKIIITSKNGMKYTSDDIQKIVKEAGINKQLPQGIEANQIEEWFSKFGRLEEEQMRTQMLLNRLKDGDLPAEAVAYVNKYQFDYTKQLNQYEEFMSHIVPFWRWQSNIMPLMASLMVTQPGKLSTWTKLMQLTWQSPEAQVAAPFAPAWASGKFLYYLGGNRSEVLNVQTPIESLTTVPNRLQGWNATTFLAPLPKIAIEEYRGVETFTGKNITDQPTYLARSLGFARMMDFWAKLQNPNIPWWEKTIELGVGAQIYQATDWIAYSGVLQQNSEKVVNNTIHRLGGSWHGCGF